ncbi:MAG: VWA domain-containing protein, partial [Firmicutes bacterium]|nr:VWA domain-containing protein [Bacillota bacterium]
MSKKKLLAIVLTLVMVLSLVPQGIFAAGEDDPPAIGDAPSTNKRLIDNEDGTYTLALSVTGEAASSTVSQVDKANIILVIDTSSSMNNSAGNTYYTVPGTPAAPSSDGVAATYYRNDNGTYRQLYYVNGAWRTENRNNAQTFTGQFYSNSRLWAEKHAMTDDDGIIDKLLAQNVAGDSNKSDIIEVAIVDFGRGGVTQQTFTTNATSLKNTINGLTTSQGTNWEEGLQQAKALADSIHTAQPNESVYVIFLTDGEPTTHNNDYTVNTNYAQEWDYAKDDARGLITSGYTFYGLFTWGSSGSTHYLSSLVQYAYTGSGNSNTAISSEYAQYYTDASDTNTLINALNQIVHNITTGVGFTNVEMTDGVTSMTTSNIKASADGKVSGVKYYRSGGSYSTTANGGLGDEWTDAPTATIAEEDDLDENGNGIHKGDIDWDLGDIVLEDGVTYTITFIVWPSQDSLDLVADLNNGIISYDSLTPAQKSQIAVSSGHYYLKTNKDYPTVTYSTVTTTTIDGHTTTVTSDPVSTTITQPDPVGLAEERLNAVKEWEDDLDPTQREEVGNSVTLYLMVDGEYYFIDPETNKPLGVKLKGEPEEGDDPETFVPWTETDYLAIAPGIMVTDKSPAWPGDNVEGVTYVTWEETKYAILEEGHDYVWEESEINYHFELTAYHHHPMIMGYKDGQPITNDVVFTYAADGKTITGIESVKPMTDNLSATNTLKGGINITKKVIKLNEDDTETVIADYENPVDLNPFKITVTMTDPDGNTLPEKTAANGTKFNIDYRIYYGKNNPKYGTEGTSANLPGGRSGHIYVSGKEFKETLYVGDVIRVVNVEGNTIYTVTEATDDVPQGYELVRTDYEIAYAGKEENRKADPDHTVQGNSASYAEVVNKLTYGTLEVTKTVTATNKADINADKEFEFTFKLYSDNTSAKKELTGTKYNYTLTPASGTATKDVIEEGGTFTLKHGDKILIDLLPEGSYYEITETADAAYNTTSTGSTGTIVKDTKSTAAFTNATKEGKLTLEKTLASGSAQVTIPSGLTFTITGPVIGKDAEGKDVNWTKTVTYAQLQAEGGNTWTVPIGSYSVTEDATTGTVAGYTMGTPSYTSPVTVAENGTGALKVENTYSQDMAKLTLKKVLGANSEQVTIPAGTTFTISGTTASGAEYKIENIKYSELGENGKTFDVPTGKYSVTEDVTTAAVTGYTLGTPTYSAEVTLTKENNTGTLTVTNTYTINTYDVKVIKTFSGITEDLVPSDTFKITPTFDGTAQTDLTISGATHEKGT